MSVKFETLQRSPGGQLPQFQKGYLNIFDEFSLGISAFQLKRSPKEKRLSDILRAFSSKKRRRKTLVSGKIIDSRGCILNFRYFFGRYIDLYVTDQACFDRKRSYGYYETLLKQLKTPEDLRFTKKVPNGERSSLIFNVFSDIISICALQLRRFSIENFWIV